MKKIHSTLITFLLIFCIGTSGYSQINRTTDTKIADILAQMPAKNVQHSNKLMEAVLSLKKDRPLSVFQRPFFWPNEVIYQKTIK